MKIYLGADHRGFELKEKIEEYLQGKEYEVFDLGNVVYDKADDYPDYAKLVAEKVSADPDNSRGVLVCGSGAGMAIVANKFKNIRAALAINPKHAFMERNDEDTNILSLTADFTDFENAKAIVDTFLTTAFSTEERHRRRVEKVRALDRS